MRTLHVARCLLAVVCYRKGWRQSRVTAVPRSRPLARTDASDRLVVVAAGAVADVELIADDGEPHGMRAKQQVTVLDRVEADVAREVRGPAAVPAHAVTIFRGFHKPQVSSLKFEVSGDVVRQT